MLAVIDGDAANSDDVSLTQQQLSVQDTVDRTLWTALGTADVFCHPKVSKRRLFQNTSAVPKAVHEMFVPWTLK